MGSRFTQDHAGMEVVLHTIKSRGLIFLDSKTINSSVGDSLAKQMNIPHLVRDVFLDNNINADNIRQQLSRAEDVARRQGYAIAIGHPHPETIAALQNWMEDVQIRGFQLVPLSYILCKKITCGQAKENNALLP